MSASREKKKRQNQVEEVVSAPEAKKGMSKTAKRFLTAVVAIILVAAIVFLGMVSSGFFTTHTTAAVVNGHKLTPAMLNYYYGSVYQETASLLEIMTDPETPLSEQEYMTDEYATWHDYMIDYALNSAANIYAIYDEAVANGYVLSDESKAGIDSEIQMLDLYAAMNGFSSADAYLAAMYGTGCDVKTYKEYATVSYTAQEYVNSVYNGLSFSQSELDAHYAANPDNFDGIAYRQYIVTSEGTTAEDGTTTYSDEAIAAAEETAAAIAEAGQGDEQAFLNKIKEFNADLDEASTLYADEIKSALPQITAEWLTDEARQMGDTTYIFNDSSSYYVLFYLGPVDHNYVLPNVRHILIDADPADTTAMEAAKAEAETILNDFLAGTATEDAFAALANEKSTDTGSNTNGGLYESIAPGTMVEPFDAWCFDEARQIGDTGIVETEYGYHVMYFSGYGEETYHNYLVNTAMVNEAYTEWQTGISSDLTWELISDKYVATR